MALNARQEFFKNNVQVERDLNKAEHVLFNYFKKVVENYRIDINDFEGIYQKIDIEKDKIRLKNLKSLPGEKTKRASIVEFLFVDQIEKSEWLGDEVMTVLASEFDDIENGVDIIIEFPGEDGAVKRLAVDLTTGREGVVNKISKIEMNLDREEMVKVKYFESAMDDHRGGLDNLPKVVLGLGAASLDLISKQMAEGLNRGEKSFELGDLKEQLMDMIIEESKYFKDKLQEYNIYASFKRRSNMIEIYDEVLRYFTKKKKEVDLNYKENDHLPNSVYRAVMEVVHRKKEPELNFEFQAV